MTLSADRIEGRRARCYCGEETESTNPLASFVQYRGPGSGWAVDHCRCGYARVAHLKWNPLTGRAGITDHEFEERGPSEFDSFYCGCRGWD